MRASCLIIAALIGCNSRNFVECEQDLNCDLSGGGRCLGASSGNMWCAYPDPTCPAGYRYSDQDVGDGLSGVCVSVDLPDAGTGVDGNTDGAPPDGVPVAPVVNGQDADLVLGQADFTSGMANGGSGTQCDAFTMSRPTGVSTNGTSLWVSDYTNNRVIQWNSLPLVNRQSGDAFVGQADGSSHVTGATQTTFASGVQSYASNDKLFVTDSLGNRVLIFTRPTTSGAPAAVVLGQITFTGTTSGKSASNLRSPTDVWTDGTRLVVSDSGNSRILIWNTIPTTNGQAANVVIGRAAFGLGSGDPEASPPTASSMKTPYGVWSNGTRLYVADMQNNRVLVWNTFPTTNGAPADLVLGQASFDGALPNANSPTPNAIGFDHPRKAVELDGALFTSDNVNNRVLVHYPIPTMSAEAAKAVLGQDTMTVGGQAATASRDRFLAPGNIAATNHNLYVPDYGFHRVLRFHIGP